MSRFEKIAVKAQNYAEQGMKPKLACSRAAKEAFPDDIASQKRSCPMGAYLGLCEEGLVRNISKGKYTRSTTNKRYAIALVRKLIGDPALAQKSPRELWALVLGKERVQYNDQFDIVLALWHAGIINNRDV